MDGKLLRCTFCGAKMPAPDGPAETVVCPYCDSVNYFRFAAGLAEKEDADKLKNLRERLRACVGEKYHDFEEMKEISDEILNLSGYDFEARYFYALALKTNNKRGKYNDFLSNPVNLPPNPESLRLVLDNIVRYAKENERTSIHTFIRNFVNDPLEREEYIDRADRQIERARRDYHGGQDVFVCHKAEDGGAAWAVAERLEADGMSCFIYERNLEDLEVGAKFENALKAAIASCRIFLFISSYKAFSRDRDNYALMEIAEAGRLGKPLAEFRIEDVDAATAAACPEYAAAFGGCQYIEAFPYFRDMLDKLSAHLTEKLARTAGGGTEFERIKAELEAENRAKEEEIARLKAEQEQTKKMLERISFEKAEAEKKLYGLDVQASASKLSAAPDDKNPEAEALYREAVRLDFDGASDEDKRRAAALYRKAADRGYPPAMFNLGVSYEEGDGVAADAAEACKWYILAADAGHAEAMFNLANCYRMGRGVPADREKAFEYFRRAADGGCVDALVNLGVAYERGEGTAPDAAKALECYKSAATGGSSAAAYNLALCYRSGIGTPVNEELFRYWLEKAAEGGAKDAEGLLGEMRRSSASGEELYNRACDLEYGANGARKDKAAAARLYAQAAAAGYAPAQLNLGVMYEYGEGVEKDLTKAVSLYRRAAEQGNTMAQCNLGYCYYAGNGVARDLSQAIIWYRRAADNGSARAYNNLGYCYEHGEGVTKSAKRAFDMYKTAAMKGDTDGAGNAAWCLEAGLGTEVDLVKAREWYAVGREKGIERARRGFERVESKLMGAPAAAEEAFRKGYAFESAARPNNEKALAAYAKAARLGSLPAVYRQGVVSRNEGNFPRALDYFRTAAAKGHIAAAVEAGEAFEKGRGCPVDQKSAMNYYAMAARAGCGDAQARLAAGCETGTGIAYSPEKAFEWYRRAAANNTAAGCTGLGLCYLEGRGTARDEKLGAVWLSRAADMNDARALLELAACYRAGKGVPADHEKERSLLIKAADAGSGKACLILGNAYLAEGNTDAAVRHYTKGARLGVERCAQALKNLRHG